MFVITTSTYHATNTGVFDVRSKAMLVLQESTLWFMSTLTYIEHGWIPSDYLLPRIIPNVRILFPEFLRWIEILIV